MRADLEMDLVRRTVRRAGQTIDLQPREFRLLEFLMRNQGRIVTRTMLLERVWDFHFDPKTSVVETHISRLRAKIDRPFAKDLIHTTRVPAIASTMVADVFSRTAVRLALGFAVLIAATVIAVFAIIYWQLSSELEQRVRLRVRESRCVERHRSHEGFSELAEVVSAEANSPRAIENIFLLVDKDGQFIAGNVEASPNLQGMARPEGDRLQAADRAERGPRSAFCLLATAFMGMLLVGGNDRDMRHVSDTLLGG